MKVTEVKLESHADEVLAELHDRVPVILEALGIEAEGNAVDEITSLGAVDTGRLRGSISHATDSDSAYIGTNVEYAPYVELGTYKMAARPFLRNAVTNYEDDYKRIIEEGLK